MSVIISSHCPLLGLHSKFSDFFYNFTITLNFRRFRCSVMSLKLDSEFSNKDKILGLNFSLYAQRHISAIKLSSSPNLVERDAKVQSPDRFNDFPSFVSILSVSLSCEMKATVAEKDTCPIIAVFPHVLPQFYSILPTSLSKERKSSIKNRALIIAFLNVLLSSIFLRLL